jgi:hypothetical protein
LKGQYIKHIEFMKLNQIVGVVGAQNQMTGNQNENGRMFYTEQQQSTSIKPRSTSNGSTRYRMGNSCTCGRMARN